MILLKLFRAVYCLLFIVFLNPGFVFSQQSKNELAPVTDSVRITKLAEQADLLASTQPDSALIYYTKADSICQVAGNEKLFLDFYSLYSWVLNNQNRFDESLKLGQRALAVSQKLNSNLDIAHAYSSIGLVYVNMSYYQLALENYFKVEGKNIAAVIIEGIQGVGGINVATNSFLQLIRKLCTEYGAVYIADGIQCGYGRSGKFFSHDHAGVNADIYSMAKGMGNGFPVAGIIIAPHIAPKHFMLGTTFGGNHLACAAALAVLEVIEREDLMNNARQTGSYLMEKLSAIPQIKNVRGVGLMIGFDVPDELKDLRKNLLWKQKIFTGEAKPNVIRLLPSLALKKRDAEDFIDALKEEIQLLTSGQSGAQTINVSIPTESVGK